MIEPAAYEGVDQEELEPDTPCAMCAACYACATCGLCLFCDCVTEPLEDVGKIGGARAVAVAAW